MNNLFQKMRNNRVKREQAKIRKITGTIIYCQKPVHQTVWYKPSTWF